MELSRMPLGLLAGFCRQETENYWRRQPFRQEYCLELLRRAICQCDDLAWQAVLELYRGLVLAWVRRHPFTQRSGEGDDHWVNRTFERFWYALTPDRFANFPDLASFLKYLKLCAHCVVLDEVRRAEAAATEPLELSAAEDASPVDVETVAIDAHSGAELWQIIREQVTDGDERLVIHMCYVLGMKPSEAQQRRPDRFPTVEDVYRIKRNVLTRLRHSPEVASLRS